MPEHIKMKNKSVFEPKSLHKIEHGKDGCVELMIGCTKNAWDKDAKKCGGGMQVQEIRVDKGCFAKNLPAKYR